MDISNWSLLYMRDYKTGALKNTNVFYNPYINNEKNIMCLSFELDSEYLETSCVKLSDELLDFYFHRELENMKLFENMPWCPRLLHIIEEERKIFIEYNDKNLNHIVTDENRNLDLECPNWREDIVEVISDLYNLGYFKITIYPHCFFYDKNNQIKTLNYYAVSSQTPPLIEIEKVKPIIGVDSENKYKDATEGDYLNLEILFKRNLLHFSRWPENIFLDLYRKIYENE